ncbi:MAG: transposase, partial [Mycobacterium sp.]
SGQFAARICDLYRSHLRFPASWSQEDCDEFIESNADMDAIRLTTKFDDLIDIVVDRYGREHWTLPHSEDSAEMIATERKGAAVSELGCSIEALS